MTNSPDSGAHALQSGTLSWVKVASIGIAIAISGNFSGWNYGLAIGGWGGMFAAALGVAVLFFCLAQCLAELVSALPQGAGFDFYARVALGPTWGCVCGMAVALALAIGTGLAATFAEAYCSALLGVGGWPIKLALFVIVIGLQLRGAEDAASMAMATGAVALAILIAFCVFAAPHFSFANLLTSSSSRSPGTLFAHGLAGTVGCIPYALFLFLGVEQAAHAASEMRDKSSSMPKALMTAIGVAVFIGVSVLLFATATAGVDRLATSNDPLFTALESHLGTTTGAAMAKVVGFGALVALMATFFSLAYAGSRQIYHLANSGNLPHALARTNGRRAPMGALIVIGVIGICAAGFRPESVMVVFIFLISVSHILLIASFLRLRRSRPLLQRPYRAIGGSRMAYIAGSLSLLVISSCYELEVRALTCSVLGLAALTLFFHIKRPPQVTGSV
jgi:ethanolamine permease